MPTQRGQRTAHRGRPGKEKNKRKTLSLLSLISLTYQSPSTPSTNSPTHHHSPPPERLRSLLLHLFSLPSLRICSHLHTRSSSSQSSTAFFLNSLSDVRCSCWFSSHLLRQLLNCSRSLSPTNQRPPFPRQPPFTEPPASHRQQTSKPEQRQLRHLFYLPSGSPSGPPRPATRHIVALRLATNHPTPALSPREQG
ncbi:uncharacterized protein LOC131166240 [Malania oleifera]|uniref:uncharacterized protein LOC131166240 n=1 Tax=Malania oleifera TaxID=397392 RepID=UPI0025ADB2FE|nr:uncharacterized protein LOC131166240 [Malania oleifera]